MDKGALYRRIRGGIGAITPPTGGGGGGSPPPMTLSASTVTIGTPKVITVSGYLAAISSTFIPTDRDGLPNYSRGFFIRSYDNTIQWDGLTNDTAGSVNIDLTDGINTVTIAVKKLMDVTNCQCEVTAPLNGFVGWLFGPPAGQTPTISPNDGRFVLASYVTGGKTVWWVRRGFTAVSVGTYDVVISCGTLDPITKTITVIADSGDHTAWPDPTAPTAPAAPTTTRTGTQFVTDNALYEKVQINSPIVVYKSRTTENPRKFIVQDITADGAGPILKHSGGSPWDDVTVQRVHSINGAYLAGNGMGVFNTLALRLNKLTVQDIYFQTTSQITSSGDIYAGSCLRSKTVTTSYGGNWSMQRVYMEGMWMASVDGNGKTIPYPNADGCSIEMYYTQLGKGLITDWYVYSTADAGLDIKAPLGNVIARIRVFDARESGKCWVSNIYEHFKSEDPRSYHFMQMCIPYDDGTLPSSKFMMPRTVHRSLYSNKASVPLVRQEVSKSAVAIQKWDIPGGSPYAIGASSQLMQSVNNDAVGAFMIIPDGSLVINNGTIITV